jgi:hypothetical protein
MAKGGGTENEAAGFIEHAIAIINDINLRTTHFMVQNNQLCNERSSITGSTFSGAKIDGGGVASARRISHEERSLDLSKRAGGQTF